MSSPTTITTTLTASSAIPPDVINNHILIKLDGPTLASVGCASSQFRAMSLNDKLWRNLCHSTWPSTDHPHLHGVISTFPSGYRSFYSNSFSTLRHHDYIHDGYVVLPPRDFDHSPELISAVDIRYKNKIVYSNTLVTNTPAPELSWPFLIDFLNPTGKANSPVKLNIPELDDELTLSSVAENLTLSWIVIDPTRKSAANLSSLKPVLVKPHYMKGYIQMRYSTLVAAAAAATDSWEEMEFRITVVCGGTGLKSGELAVEGLYLEVVDMDERQLKVWQTLSVLRDAMDNGRRGNRDGEEKERYEEHLNKLIERDLETKERINKALKGWSWKGFEELIICFAVICWRSWDLFKLHILRINPQ